MAQHPGWPSAAQVRRIQRWRRFAGKDEHEVSYAVTGVPRELADAETLLAWNRGYWAIENRSHYVRDETMGEDASQVRKGCASQV